MLHYLHNKTKQFRKKILDILKTKTFLFRISVYILLPLFIICVLFLTVSFFYQREYTNLLERNFSTRMEASCNKIEAALETTSSNVEMFAKSPQLMEYANSEDFSVETLSKDFLEEISGFENPMLDSVFIYDKNSSLVYKDKTVYSQVLFFTSIIPYSSYGTSYWENYPDNAQTKYVLPLSYSIINNDAKLLMPIVFCDIGAFQDTECLIVVNINISQLIANETENKLLENSEFLIVDTDTRKIYNETMNFSKKFDNTFYPNISNQGVSVFSCKLDGKRQLVISYNPTKDANLPYIYVSAIPRRSIWGKMSALIILLIIALMIMLLTIFYASTISVQKIYSPIKKLSNLFEKDETGRKADPLLAIENGIQNITLQNYELSNKLGNILPLATERNLIDILNGGAVVDSVVENFKNKYFCAIIVKLIPRNKFYELYNSSEYDIIKVQLSQYLISLFSAQFDAYSVPSSHDSLYLLLNLSDNSEETNAAILHIIEDFKSVLRYDNEYMLIETAIGEVLPGIDGLKASHGNALALISSKSGLSQINTKQKKNNIINTISIFEDNSIYNNLLLGKFDEAKKTIETIINRNIESDSDGMSKLYIQLINIIFKAYHAKGIEYDEKNIGDISIISDIINRPKKQIYDTIIYYVDALKNRTQTKRIDSKIHISDYISYMELHFMEDVSLTTVSSHFNTSPRYMSKLIKEKLNITFTTHLAMLRINRAKELLLDTDLSIADIYLQSGFNSKNTFLRTFKDNMGITPSEFRKAQKRHN